KGPQNDLAARVLAFLIALEAKFGTTGTPMHDPLAMGVVLDPTFVKTKAMRVDVELKGQFTRGQTVGNKNNVTEKYEEREGRLVMVDIVPLEPNTRVALEVDAERFLTFFTARLAGK
ncbi:MAG: nucleoside hydrolase, partial [Vicinamibacterales bacterium]